MLHTNIRSAYPSSQLSKDRTQKDMSHHIPPVDITSTKSPKPLKPPRTPRPSKPPRTTKSPRLNQITDTHTNDVETIDIEKNDVGITDFETTDVGITDFETTDDYMFIRNSGKRRNPGKRILREKPFIRDKRQVNQDDMDDEYSRGNNTYVNKGYLDDGSPHHGLYTEIAIDCPSDLETEAVVEEKSSVNVISEASLVQTASNEIMGPVHSFTSSKEPSDQNVDTVEPGHSPRKIDAPEGGEAPSGTKDREVPYELMSPGKTNVSHRTSSKDRKKHLEDSLVSKVRKLSQELLASANDRRISRTERSLNRTKKHSSPTKTAKTTEKTCKSVKSLISKYNAISQLENGGSEYMGKVILSTGFTT